MRGAVMRDPAPSLPPNASASRYRAEVLPDARPAERGVAYRRDDAEALVEWSRIWRAVAAEVGEPEGVRTIVFDLIVERRETPEGAALAGFRMDADPGEDAIRVARQIEAALGRERVSPWLSSVARDGLPSRCYPDLESFEAAVLEHLEKG